MLTLLSEGAYDETYQQLVKGLHISSDKTAVANQYQNYLKQSQKNAGTAKFSVANKIFIKQDYQLNRTFQNVATNKFMSGVQPLNFDNSEQSTRTINNFVAKETDNKITKLLSADQVGPSTRIVLVNAIYFNGNWTYQFNKQKSFQKQFTVSETQTAGTTFMTNINNYKYTELPDLGARAVELSYSNSSFGFVILLPNHKYGYSTFEQKLKKYDWTKLTANMQSQKVNLTIPKFTAEFSITMNDVLSKVCALH